MNVTLPLATDPTSLSVVLKGYVWWTMIPLAMGLAWAIVKLYKRESEPYGAAGRRLRVLRASAVVLLVILLSQPVLHRVIASYQAPLVIVLRDRSSSMIVKDAHDPLERRVRIAITLGLLDGKLRDANADLAAQTLVSAQNSVESAAAGARQAQQLLQESTVNVSAAHDRAKGACEALATGVSRIQAGAKQLGDLPAGGKELMPGCTALADLAERLRKELGEVVLDGADAAVRLQEKARAVAALGAELAKSAAAARQLQDRTDRALGESDKAEVKAALAKLAEMDRAAVASVVLDGKAAEAASGKVEFVQYGFDTDLRELVSGKDKREPDHTRSDTDLATPLLRIAERHAQDSVAAVVICSDGRHTSGPAPEDAARVLAARGIVVHTLGVGSPDAPPDICVAKLDGAFSVFMEETIRLTAHIKVSGMKGKSCTLALTRGDKPIQQRELKLGDDGWLHENFEFPADKAGPNVFTASIKPLPGEVMTDNNSAEAIVDVAGDRLKVLLVDELPRWETRYVASLLRRERKMTLDERWLLSGENLGARPKALPEDEKALEEFEVVVLGDVPSERLSDADQKRLVKYVSDRGGFLVMIAGPKSMPQSYLAGPIADLLPVRQQSGDATAAPFTSAEASERIRVKLDPAGASHEIVRILRDPALNEQLWPALPELHWVARPAFAKPGATPLLVTDDARKDVVVATQNFGAGRVLYVGTDGTWNWRYKVADRVHAFFWSQAVRWGTSNRLIGGPRLKAGCDRRQVRPGDRIEVLARPRDSEGKPTADATLVAELSAGDQPQRVALQFVPESGGLFRGYLQNLPAGVHNITVKVESPGFEGIQQELQVIAREAAGQEGIELARDAARLSALAKVGGGSYYDIQEAPTLFAQLAGQGRERTTESSYEVWASYPALILVVLILGIEWILRKRMGLA